MCTVSVLVTVYNREPFLADCLNSILASTWQDFEIVVVDDHSSDGSVAIAEEFVARDSRIRLYRNERNIGDYPNRAKAISHSAGALIKFVDADDLIYRNSLAMMVEAMEQYPGAALALSHSAPELEVPYPFPLSPEETYRRQFLSRGCLGSGPSGAIFRRSAYDGIGGFGDWGVLTDMDLWLRIAARWQIVLLPPALIWWRRHEGQEFTRGNAANVYLQRGFDLASQTLNGTNSPLVEAARVKALARVRQHHARRILALGMRRGRARDAWQVFRSSGLGWGELMSGLKPYQ